MSDSRRPEQRVADGRGDESAAGDVQGRHRAIRDLIGQPLRMGGDSFTIIGVMLPANEDC